MARLGDFWHIATFKTVTKTDDGSGGYFDSFSNLCTTRGSLTRTGGARVFIDGKDMMTDLCDFVCFYKTSLEDNITKDTVIVIEGSTFEILNYWRQLEDRRFYTFQIQRIS